VWLTREKTQAICAGTMAASSLSLALTREKTQVPFAEFIEDNARLAREKTLFPSQFFWMMFILPLAPTREKTHLDHRLSNPITHAFTRARLAREKTHLLKTSQRGFNRNLSLARIYHARRHHMVRLVIDDWVRLSLASA
jgi:hypothetical protein